MASRSDPADPVAAAKRALKGPRWKRLRAEILRRDRYRCVKCESVLRLQVDHILPVAVAPARAFNPRNLQTLCQVCHSRKTARQNMQKYKHTEEQVKWRKLVKEGVE